MIATSISAGRTVASTCRRLASAAGRLLWLMAKPMRRKRGRGPIVLDTFRGYGSRDALFLIGRVLSQPSGGEANYSASGNLWNVVRRMLRHGVAGARLVATVDGQTQGLITDRDGYFRLRMRLTRPLPPGRTRQTVHLRLIEPLSAEAVGEVIVAPPDCRFMVISDIDDTVLATGVANKARMISRMLLKNAESRVAFEGVAALYRRLHQGRSGCEHNPLLYVSRGPWVIYETLEDFFELHGFPGRPVLFLREWGLRLRPPFIRRQSDHKIEMVNELLAVSPDLPVVLIGDSGQHDPELYADVVRSWPDRVRLVLIRDVTGDSRSAAVGDLAQELAKAGTTLVLAERSDQMATAAAEAGLIELADATPPAAEQATTQAAS